MHNAELHPLYSSPNIFRNCKLKLLRWAEYVARVELCRNAYRVLVGRSEGKRPLERPRREWEEKRVDLSEVGCDSGDWIGLAQDNVQYKEGNEPPGSLKAK